MRRTDSRHCASWMASEQDVVVLPVDRNVDDTSRRSEARDTHQHLLYHLYRVERE